MTSFIDLNGKIAIVTGASRGIGQGIALSLSKCGAKVIINYNSDQAGAQQTHDLIMKNGGESKLIQADVSLSLECKRLVEETVKEFGKVDVLVNNAGMSPFVNFFDITEDTWFQTINTNLSSTFFLSQAVARHMRKQGGSIINIGSITMFIGSKTQVHYAASKGGIFSMTRSMAVSLGEFGIRVNSLAVGGITTEMSKEQHTSEYVNWLTGRLPLHRMGKPYDVGELVAFLASDKASWMTGACIPIDGGRLVAP